MVEEEAVVVAAEAVVEAEVEEAALVSGAVETGEELQAVPSPET